MNASTRRLRAGAVILTSDDVRASSEVVISTDGLIEDVRPAARLTAAEQTTLLAPAWINAHTHLDLGALGDEVSRGGGFLAWVGALMAQRAALEAGDLARGARTSADELVASGTALAIDIDSGFVAPSVLADHPLRRVRLVELIDASPAGSDDRTAAALLLAEAALGSHDAAEIAVGWSPHGTHTVGDALLRGLERLVSSSGGPAPPTAIHWAETQEEVDWLERGEGPFGNWLGASPGLSGIERLERAGRLGGALLVHGNFPSPGDLDRIARARPRPAVVHCPGSHVFFDRAPFDADALRAHGIALALGTDSRASNASLDMRREVRLARESLGLSAAGAFRSATETPAAFVPDPTITGTLRPGSVADVVSYAMGGVEPSFALEHVTTAEPRVLAVHIGGARAWPLDHS